MKKRKKIKAFKTFWTFFASRREGEKLGLVWVSDKNLVQKVLAGEAEAFNLLVKRWEKKLFNFGLRLTGNRDEALDIAQESFTRAFEQIRQLKDPDKFPQWLFRIARNCWISNLRSDQSALTESLTNDIEGAALDRGSSLRSCSRFDRTWPSL